VATVHHGLRHNGALAPVQRWSVPTHIDLREWDGEFVARCDASSATYLLSALAGESLRALQAGATSAQQIVARVFDTESPPPPEGTTAALAWMFGGRDTEVERVLAVLHELETLGIARAHAG
jgi:hypothetical protein